MPEKIEEATRKQVAKLLPRIAKKVLGDYQNLINMDPTSFEDDNKKHKNYYDACKAAVTHLQVLLKLAEWTETPTEKNGFSSDDIDRLMVAAQAQIEVAKQAANYDEDEEEVA